MGTVATVELVDCAGAERLLDDVFAWLHEVDRRFSTYRADSEVSRLNRGDLGLADRSVELDHVIDRCAALWLDTNGYFDPYATGRFDPSGYVKGWSVQVASELLTAGGAGDHLIEVGGDIQTRGRPAPGVPWEIGIRHPFQRDTVSWVVAGTDLAVATSGIYERGLHVVDPLTGRPAATFSSVTVVGRDLGSTDAYATAALAMGIPALSWLARLDGYESAVVTRDGDCYTSPRFAVEPRVAPV